MADRELNALEVRAIAGRLAARLLAQALKDFASALGRNDKHTALRLLGNLKQQTEITFKRVEGLPGAERADVQAAQSVVIQFMSAVIEDATAQVTQDDDALPRRRAPALRR